MNRITIFVVLMVLLLNGCTLADKNTMEEPSESLQPAMDSSLAFSFQVSVAESLPLFAFEVYEAEINGYEYYTYKYDIKIS